MLLHPKHFRVKKIPPTRTFAQYPWESVGRLFFYTSSESTKCHISCRSVCVWAIFSLPKQKSHPPPMDEPLSMVFRYWSDVWASIHLLEKDPNKSCMYV
ncbi:hypothetical protein XENTR_v10011374 [Xenopus tropicalis]|nr:hypothetical protein XENTR_v10011374 [Xenopus tropicalis]